MYTIKITKIIFAALLLTSCNPVKTNDINIELSDFTKDVAVSFIENKNTDNCNDHTCTYVIRCYENTLDIFSYKGFSHTDYVGKAIVGNQLVKVYGEKKSIYYRELHKTREKEKYDTDGDYVEDLESWYITVSNDTIRFVISDDDTRKVKIVGDLCRMHFPEAVIFWQRDSFRLDDIRL